ncbi:hypothetical protein HYX15_02155 [Candidatus Woesearchaeota archaeon]|nr:hypothetical protein [Candidatus Woesearchaeota archaeon]
MENLSLEERVLYGCLPPSIVDVNMLNGKTDVQYLEEGNKIIQYFKDSLKDEKERVPNIIPYSIKSQENFIEFFSHLKESWGTYLDLSVKMASFSENLSFLFPEKIGLFRDLAETTFKLNTHLYYITDIEKEIYEKGIENLPEERALSLIQSVKSFPVYLSEEIGEGGVSTKNPYEIREMLSKNPNLRKLFSLSGSSINSFGKLLSHFAPLNRKSEREIFTPEDDYEKALKEILSYDHFFELFLREGGILMNDLKFYIDLSNRLSCSRDIPELLKKLEDSKEDAQISFNPKIPSYTQTSLSCGATCLANVVGTYYPHINVTRSLENGIHKLVTVPGFFNNLPSSLAYISKEKFGIPTHFFADYKSFAPLFLDKKTDQEPVKKFQEDYERVKSSSFDYGDITTEEIKSKLEKGHLISFVTGQSPMLHYKMIVGYNFRGDKKQFRVFDPQYGVTNIGESEILLNMRNDKSLWGVEYVPPESVIFDSTRESIIKAKELLRWNPQ